MSLLKKIKTLSKESFFYGVGGTLTSLVSFFLLPLYTNYLSPEDYGYLSIFTSFQSVTEIATIFGLSSALFRYYLLTDSETEKKKVFSTCFWTQVLIIVVLGLLLISLSGIISQLLFSTGEQAKNIRYVTLSSLGGAITVFGFSFIRAKRKVLFFISLQIAKALMITCLNVYFVAFLGDNYEGVILSTLIVSLITSVVILISIQKYLSFDFSSDYFRRMLAFASPIFLVNVLFFVLNLSDRFFLNYFGTKSDVGLYSYGSKLGSVVTLAVITPFATAVLPYALSIAKEKDFKYTFSKIMKYFTMLVFAVSVGVFLFSKEIVMLISDEGYYEATGIIGPILLSGICYGLYYNLSIALDIVEKTYLLVYVVLCGALVSIAGNSFLITYLGFYGSAVSNVVSNGVLFMLTYLICQRHFSIPYETNAFLRMLIIIMFYVVLKLFAIDQINSLFLSITIKGAMVLMLPILFYKLNVMDEGETLFLRQKLKELRGS